MPLSAYGVDLTPPAPISYALPTKLGDISSVISSLNKGQNDANAANNQRYQQILNLLSTGGQHALNASVGGYNAAIGSLGTNLGRTGDMLAGEQQRIADASKAASAKATQSAISRGLGNTTIADSLQRGVDRASNQAYLDLAAKRAEIDNDTYKNIANLQAQQGSAASALYNQGAGTIANAIQARNDIGPQIGDYAGLIQSAAAAQNSGGRTVTRTVDPIPINSPLRTGGSSGGGISASMGQGYSSSGTGGGGNTTNAGTGQYIPPGTGNYNPGGYTPSAPMGSISQAVSSPAPAPAPSAPSIPPIPSSLKLQDTMGDYEGYLARMRMLSLTPWDYQTWLSNQRG